jgi:hypothetical protein
MTLGHLPEFPYFPEDHLPKRNSENLIERASYPVKVCQLLHLRQRGIVHLEPDRIPLPILCRACPFLPFVSLRTLTGLRRRPKMTLTAVTR